MSIPRLWHRLVRNCAPWLGAALLVLCSACASVAPRAGTAVAPYRDIIALSGKIAVHYPQNGAQQHLSGSYSWQQDAGGTDVALFSPLGQTVAQVRVRPQLATLTQAGQAPRAAPDVDALTTEVLGWPLPVSGLRLWLQGRALDAQGRPFAATPQHDSVTTQDGWRVRYVWTDDAITRIDAVHPLASADAEVALRITIEAAP